MEIITKINDGSNDLCLPRCTELVYAIVSRSYDFTSDCANSNSYRGDDGKFRGLAFPREVVKGSDDGV